MQFCDFIATKDSSYVTRNLWKPQDKGKKKVTRVLQAEYSALLRHKFLGSAILHTFEHFFVSTTSHKEQQRFRLYEHLT